MTERNQQDVAAKSFEILAKAEKLNRTHNQEAEKYSNALLQAAQEEAERITKGIDKERTTLLETLEKEILAEEAEIESLKEFEQNVRGRLRTELSEFLKDLSPTETFEFEFNFNDFVKESELEAAEIEDTISIELLVDNFINQFEQPSILVVEDREPDEHPLITKAYEIYDQYTKESRDYLENLVSRAQGITREVLKEAYETQSEELEKLSIETKDLKAKIQSLSGLKTAYNNYLYNFLRSFLVVVEEGIEEEVSLEEQEPVVEEIQNSVLSVLPPIDVEEAEEERENLLEEKDEREDLLEEKDEREDLLEENSFELEEEPEETDTTTNIIEDISDDDITKPEQLENVSDLSTEPAEVETETISFKVEEVEDIDTTSLFQETADEAEDEIIEKDGSHNILEIVEEGISTDELYDESAAEANKDEVEDAEQMIEEDSVDISSIFSIEE